MVCTYPEPYLAGSPGGDPRCWGFRAGKPASNGAQKCESILGASASACNRSV